MSILILTAILILGLIYISNILKNKPTVKKEIKSIIYILIAIFLIRSYIIEPFRIPSGSMEPTILIGDFILVNKFKYTFMANISKPKRGDIIVFKHKSGLLYIKRLIGLPGDKIEYKNKKIYINNIQIKTEYNGKFLSDIDRNCFKEIININKKYNICLKNDNKEEYKFNNITIPDNLYFVLGDNRDNSDDSRYWGFVDKKDLLGEALLVWMNYDKEKIKINLQFKILN